MPSLILRAFEQKAKEPQAFKRTQKLSAANFAEANVVAIIKHYMPLVRQIARRYSHFHPDSMEDLSQVGYIGLLKAIRYYNPKRTHCASFKTLAVHYIRGEIRHYLRDYSSLVQIPRRLSEINSRLSKLDEQLFKLLDRAPTIQELTEASGYTQEEILQAQQSWEARTKYESFESNIEEEERDDKRFLLDLLPDKKYQEWQDASEELETLRQALKHLGVKAREVIEFVFFYDLSQKETASVLGLSEMGVSRVVHSALNKLREVLMSEDRQ